MGLIFEILLFPLKLIGWMVNAILTITMPALALLFGKLMKPKKKDRYGRR